MKNSAKQSNSEYYRKLKWLMFSRILFTSLLLGSTIMVQLSENIPVLSKPLLLLYALITGIFLLSLTYAIIFRQIKREIFFAYIQVGVDTFIVTLIIFVTGSSTSIFSFLYLVVIIYSSMLLFRKGSMIMASLCTIQYGMMIDLEYFGILKPLATAGSGFAVGDYS